MRIPKHFPLEEDTLYQNTKARGLHYLILKDQSDSFNLVKV